jgi:hypothetical protein
VNEKSKSKNQILRGLKKNLKGYNTFEVFGTSKVSVKIQPFRGNKKLSMIK